jgi:hypothetical protein
MPDSMPYEQLPHLLTSILTFRSSQHRASRHFLLFPFSLHNIFKWAAIKTFANVSRTRDEKPGILNTTTLPTTISDSCDMSALQ